MCVCLRRGYVNSRSGTCQGWGMVLWKIAGMDSHMVEIYGNEQEGTLRSRPVENLALRTFHDDEANLKTTLRKPKYRPRTSYQSSCNSQPTLKTSLTSTRHQKMLSPSTPSHPTDQPPAHKNLFTSASTSLLIIPSAIPGTPSSLATASTATPLTISPCRQKAVIPPSAPLLM